LRLHKINQLLLLFWEIITVWRMPSS
jgi:hypothetical protein